MGAVERLRLIADYGRKSDCLAKVIARVHFHSSGKSTEHLLFSCTEIHVILLSTENYAEMRIN